MSARLGVAAAAFAWATLAGLVPAAADPESGTQAPARGVVERDVVYVDPPPGTTITHVIIDNRLGNVRIEGADQPGITVMAKKRAADHQTLDRLKVTLVPDPSGPIRIATALLAGEKAGPIAAGSAGIDLVIRAPRAALAEATAWKGRLTVTGMDGGARLTTNEGKIVVDNVAGQVVTYAARGDQDIKNVFGSLDAEGLIGDLALVSVTGKSLVAAVHRGTITARDIRVHEAELRVFSGHIDLLAEVVLGGHYRVQTVTGNIRVRMRGHAPVQVTAFSKNGRVAVARGLSPQRTLSEAVIGHRGPARGASSWEVTSRMGNIRFVVLAE